jgi:hypothetical protein
LCGAAIGGPPKLPSAAPWTERAFLGGKMTEFEFILILMTFVLPAVLIVADNSNWQRKKN